MVLVKRPFIVPRDPGPESGVDKEGVSGCCFRFRGRSTARQLKHKHKHKHTSTLYKATQAQCIRKLKHTSTAENSLSPAVISNASALMGDGPIGLIRDHEDSSWAIHGP